LNHGPENKIVVLNKKEIVENLRAGLQKPTTAEIYTLN
jgi:hypothetical protein